MQPGLDLAGEGEDRRRIVRRRRPVEIGMDQVVGMGHGDWDTEVLGIAPGVGDSNT